MEVFLGMPKTARGERWRGSGRGRSKGKGCNDRKAREDMSIGKKAKTGERGGRNAPQVRTTVMMGGR